MDLIDRYLHAVKGHLPADQHDVVAELEDDLRSRVNEREQEIGRPLTEDEIGGILKALGRPMVFASRYLKHQALIGPAMFPYYLQTLKVAAAIALLVNVVVAVVMLALGKPVGEGLAGLIAFPFKTLPMLVGWITVVFAVIDRYVTASTFRDAWDPRTLGPVPSDSPGRPRVAIVGDIIGLGFTLAWWLAVMRVPFLMAGPLAAFIEPGPGWTNAYLPVAVMMLLGIAGHALTLIRPGWRRPMRIAGHLLALSGLALLLLGGDLVVPSSVSPPPQLAHGVELVNRFARGLLGFIIAITLFELGRDLWKVWRTRTTRADGRMPA